MVEYVAGAGWWWGRVGWLIMLSTWPGSCPGTRGQLLGERKERIHLVIMMVGVRLVVVSRAGIGCIMDCMGTRVTHLPCVAVRKS